MSKSSHPTIKEKDDVALVQIIWDYLAGEEIRLIRDRLRRQCENYDIACKDRYEGIYDRNLTKTHQYEVCVDAILDALSVPLAKKDHYKKAPNLYALLKKLEPDYRHLTYLIQSIDETNPPRRWAKSFFVAAIGVAGLTVLFWFKKNYVTRLAVIGEKVLAHFLYGLDKALMLVRNTPLLGLLYNGIALIWAWHQAFKDGFELEHDKLSVLFLRNVEHVFAIVGFLLCFFAGGVMTPAAFALFFVGSAIDAVEGAYSFIKHEIELWLDPPLDSEDYYGLTARMRVETLRSRDKVVLLTNILATALIMASVVIWCLFPPSWVITISCIVCGWLVGMSKGFSIDYINDRYANKMQRNLDQIKEEHESEWKPLPSKQALTDAGHAHQLNRQLPREQMTTNGLRFFSEQNDADDADPDWELALATKVE